MKFLLEQRIKERIFARDVCLRKIIKMTNQLEMFQPYKPSYIWVCDKCERGTYRGQLKHDRCKDCGEFTILKKFEVKDDD